jgi:redox-regulated HSP33 family molecular chaperone
MSKILDSEQCQTRVWLEVQSLTKPYDIQKNTSGGQLVASVSLRQEDPGCQ